MSSAVIRAARDGCEAEVWDLICSGVDVNARGRSGRCDPALIEAAAKGHFSIVCLLVNHGASVELYGPREHTVVYAALVHGYEEMAIYLFKAMKGPNHIIDMCTGSTALHVACRMRFIKAVRVFLQFGANIDAKTLEGRTALDLLQQWESSDTNDKSRPQRRIQLVQLLLQSGAEQAEDIQIADPQSHVHELPCDTPGIRKVVEEKGGYSHIRNISSNSEYDRWSTISAMLNHWEDRGVSRTEGLRVEAPGGHHISPHTGPTFDQVVLVNQRGTEVAEQPSTTRPEVVQSQSAIEAREQSPISIDTEISIDSMSWDYYLAMLR
jgi:hypothetical protein